MAQSLRLIILSIVLLSLVSCSRKSGKFVERLPGGGYITNDASFFASHQDALDEEYLKKAFEEVVGSSPNNSCIGYQNPSTVQQQLLEFIQGPCSPVVMVPGILGSKLTVNIDCPALQAGAPDIFSACEWTTCDSGWFDNNPDSEYTVWITDIYEDPMSVFSTSKSNCWGGLIQLGYNASQPNVADRYTNPPGVTVSVYGADNSTRGVGDCGFFAMSNLLDEPSFLQTQTTQAFVNLQNAFLNLGYQTGLSLYGVPYDWRKCISASGVLDMLSATIEQAYNITGKPVVIMSHSYGNTATLKTLNMMTFAQKQQMIASWFSMMPPINGAPKGIPAILGGNVDFTGSIAGFTLGLSVNAEQLLDYAFSGAFDLLPQATFERFALEPWMIEWAQRQYLEDTYNITTPQGYQFWQNAVQTGHYPLEYFPTPLDICTPFFTQKSSECSLSTYNWSNITSFFIDSNGEVDSFTCSQADMKTMFENFNGFFPIWENLLNDSVSSGVFNLTNPEVPTIVVYASHLWTLNGGVYTSNPLYAVQNGEFLFPATQSYTQGDGTVSTTGSLIPAIKWAWEFNHNHGNAQPIKLLEFCSVYNQRGTPYDVINSDDPYEMTSVEYIGMNCECLTGTPGNPVEGSDCSHAAGISDPNLINFAINLAFGNIKNNNTANTGACLLNDQQLQQVKGTCPSMFPGTQIYWTFVNQSTGSTC